METAFSYYENLANRKGGQGTDTLKSPAQYSTIRKIQKQSSVSDIINNRALSDIDLARIIDFPWLNLLYDDVSAIIKAINDQKKTSKDFLPLKGRESA